MVLLPTTIIAHRMLLKAWNSWCIVMLVVIVIEASAQDPEALTVIDRLPPQCRGLDMSHEAYCFVVFGCDKPEDVLTQSIPHGCSVKALDGKTQDTDMAPKQEYTILKRVAMLEYPTSLCTLCRSCNYYDCVWKLHVRIDAPAMVYQHETIQVQECATTVSTGVFKDPMSRTKHCLNPKLEVNNFASTVLGSLTYEGRHSHFDGMDSSINSRRMSSLFVTESLEGTIRTVTVREEFDSEDIVVRENGVSIPAAFRQDQGVVADFRILVFRRQQASCQWKKVRDITAARLPRIGLGGIGLVNDNQEVHITIHDPVTEAPSCPTNYLWSSTGDSCIRVVQKINAAARGEEDFLPL